ncbi:nucleotide-diphospho-sugar transferase [Chytridium lagenaria]|nr:nucleotide-diphospho-sugar transferase [Chytridium lagenaria]
MTSLKGIILVGGPSVGTRFRPLSMGVPKPFFPIAGSPMIYHHVSSLAKVPGMKEIILIGFFENNVFDRFLTEVQMEFSSISIRYLREYQALAPPVVSTTSVTKSCEASPITKSSPSTPQRKPKPPLWALKCSAILVHKFGCIVLNPDTAEVLHFVENQETVLSETISCGIYLFEESIFAVMAKAIAGLRAKALEDGVYDTDSLEDSRPSLLSMSEVRIRLEQDVLSLLTEEKKLYCYVGIPGKDFWMQLKTGSSTIPANRNPTPRLSSITPNIVTSPGGATPSQSSGLIPPVYIHPTAIVHPPPKLNDSCIVNAIIGWESRVGAWARVEGSPEESLHINATQKGMKVPSAAILGKCVTVADETAIRNCIVLPNKELKASFHNEILM